MPTKSTKTKFGNQPFWLNKLTGETFLPKHKIPASQKNNFEYWDSIFEFQAYRHLCKFVSPAYIQRQLRVRILPSDASFKALTWDVDFAVHTSTGIFYIEAKGEWLLYNSGEMNDFSKMLRFLSQNKPDVFNNLSIVSTGEWCIDGTNIYTQTLKNFTI